MNVDPFTAVLLRINQDPAVMEAWFNGMPKVGALYALRCDRVLVDEATGQVSAELNLVEIKGEVKA